MATTGCELRDDWSKIASSHIRRIRNIAAWFRTRPLALILILLLVSELFSSGCAARRTTAIGTIDRARLEEHFPPGTNVRIARRSGAEDQGEVHALRDSTLVLEFESRELIGHPDTVSIPFSDILAIRGADPNPVRSISAMGVGLMFVTFGFIVAVVVFGLDPLPTGG